MHQALQPDKNDQRKIRAVNKQQRERMAALACDLVKLPLGGAVLYPVFQDTSTWEVVFFGMTFALFLIYVALILEKEHD